MNNRELLRKKIEYATPEELLFLLLNDTSNKFKKVIELWKENKVEGTILAGKLHDNLLELKLTLNTNMGDEKTREALENISAIYTVLINEVVTSSLKKDFQRLEKAYDVFLTVKNIFDEDRKNMT